MIYYTQGINIQMCTNQERNTVSANFRGKYICTDNLNADQNNILNLMIDHLDKSVDYILSDSL